MNLPSQKYRRRMTALSIAGGVIGLACVYTQFNPFTFFSELHFVQSLLGEMLPPNFEALLNATSIGQAFLQTMSMAFLGMLYGAALAALLAFMAARNTMPYGGVRVITRLVLSVMRIIPALVVILVFVIAVGLGAFAGMLTLVFITAGLFGKLFLEMIENVEAAPSDAIFSVGASQLQVIRYSIIPQMLPSFIANLLYAFDVNFRVAVWLGIFGGGGIGFQLFLAMRVLHYKDAMAYLCFIIVLVVIVEKISDHFRREVLSY